MGLPIDNINQPGVPAASGSSSNNVKDLIAARGRLVSELDALLEVLESHGVDMNTPLVTPDGFPRDDIDVAMIRTTRSRILRLQNDIKALMKRIETGLHEYFRQQSESAESAASETDVSAASAETATAGSADLAASVAGMRVAHVAFARVESVASGSPAQRADLRVGDKIVHFGSVLASSHEPMRLIASVVATSEGKNVPVAVLRGDSDVPVHLDLVPATGWGGRGMLGCHIVPL